MSSARSTVRVRWVDIAQPTTRRRKRRAPPPVQRISAVCTYVASATDSTSRASALKCRRTRAGVRRTLELPLVCGQGRRVAPRSPAMSIGAPPVCFPRACLRVRAGESIRGCPNAPSEPRMHVRMPHCSHRMLGRRLPIQHGNGRRGDAEQPPIVAMGQRARSALMNPYPSAIRSPFPGETRPLRKKKKRIPSSKA